MRLGILSMSGFQMVETISAVERVQDWSGCRSVSRAMRRHKQGHKTRMKQWDKPAAYRSGNVIYIHPQMARELRQELATQANDMVDAMAYAAMGVKL